MSNTYKLNMNFLNVDFSTYADTVLQVDINRYKIYSFEVEYCNITKENNRCDFNSYVHFYIFIFNCQIFFQLR